VTGLIAIYVCVIASTTVLAIIGVLSPRRLSVRACAALAAIALLASGYFGLADLMSRPKPVRLAWAEGVIQEAEVISARLEEGEAIYLWLALDDEAEPRAYKLPWNQRQAEALQMAQREAQATGQGGTVRVRRPFASDSTDEVPERMFYAPPQSPLPPKPPELGMLDQ
jgi:hypothetical protein